MAVSAVTSSETINYTSEASKTTNEVTVDTETFLNLLVAQMKYQDPLEPQTDTAFVTQLAQMSSLQQLQLTNTTLKNSQAYDMIGQAVYAEVLDSDTGETTAYSGTVSGVVIKDGVPYVVVGNQALNIDDILQVYPATVEEDTTDTTTDDTADTV